MPRLPLSRNLWGSDMYGKWVPIEFNDEVRAQVYVWCTPETTDKELRERATKILTNAVLGKDEE